MDVRVCFQRRRLPLRLLFRADGFPALGSDKLLHPRAHGFFKGAVRRDGQEAHRGVE